MLSELEFKLPVGGLISAGIGLIFIFIGNYMPRIRPNYTFGIRLPWTLANETVWYKTHRVGGALLMAAGIVQTLLFFHCPHCGALWDTRGGIPDYCPKCGKKIKG